MRLNNMTHLVRLRQASTDTLSNPEGKVGAGGRAIPGGGWSRGKRMPKLLSENITNRKTWSPSQVEARRFEN